MAHIGPYELGVEIGRGLHGTVYRARNPRDAAEVALKVVALAPSTSAAAAREVLARFQREVALTASLDHPGIAAVRDAGVDGTTLWMAMELVGGTPLSEFADPLHRLEPRRIARLVKAAAEVLAHIHSRGIVHRDVTAQNLVLLAGDRVTLLDFGIARLADSTLTVTGEFLGTPRSISPEQIRGEKPGPAADQFALGVLAYHLLTGAWPFDGKEATDLFQAMLSEPPRSLSAHRPELPGAVGRALERALRADPAERFPDVMAFAKELDDGFDADTVLPPRQLREEAPGARRDVVPLAGLPARAAGALAGVALSPSLRRVRAVGILVLLIAACWLAVAAPWRAEERIARAAERGDLAGARASLDAWRLASPEDPRLLLAEGHVAFAADQPAHGAEAYARAVKGRPSLAADARLGGNLDRALPSGDARAALRELAPALPAKVGRRLWRELESDHYWRRWNAARMLEARGEGDDIDRVPLYIADLESAGSCQTRKSAAEELGRLGDARALPAIRKARDDSKNAFCFMRGTLDRAEAALRP